MTFDLDSIANCGLRITDKVVVSTKTENSRTGKAVAIAHRIHCRVFENVATSLSDTVIDFSVLLELATPFFWQLMMTTSRKRSLKSWM